MSFGVTTSNIFEALSGGDRALNRKVVKKTEQTATQQKPQQQKQEKPVEHKAPVGAVLAKQSGKANAPTQDKAQRPQSAPVKTEQKSQASEQQKGGFQTQERKQRPRPQTAQQGEQTGEKQQKPRGPRAPRQEGDNQDRPRRQEGERKPRQEGDRKPRQEGDKEFRPRRQEGDRPARRPRQEGENGENAPLQEGERKQYGQRVGPRRGREFERHSGTGRGREVAKDGEGAHSWGKAGGKGDILAATEDVLSPVTGDKVEETETPAEPKEKTPEQIEEEENAKLVTYDEFLKKKSKGNTDLAKLKKPAPRVAGEGEEQQDLKGVVVKKAPKQKKVKTEAATEKKAASTEGKKTVSIQEFLKDVEVPNKRRENRDRENRGGDRNREGGDRKPFNKDNRKGGDRNNNRDNRRPASGNQSPVPNVNDEASFPSLGKQ